MVAFVARDDETRARFLRTRRILARVGPRLSFEVPRPLGPLERIAPCDLRTRTRGAVGDRWRERISADAAHAARVAVVVADMLAGIHGALTGIELDAFGLALPPWPPSGALLRERAAFADDPIAAAEVCARWDAWLAARNPRHDVLLHGDVDLHNVAFDPATGLPLSLFDFHEAGRGPRALDFAAVPTWGPRVLDDVLTRYPREPGVARADVRLAHAARAIAGLSPDASDIRRAAARTAIADCLLSGNTAQGA